MQEEQEKDIEKYGRQCHARDCCGNNRGARAVPTPVPCPTPVDQRPTLTSHIPRRAGPTAAPSLLLRNDGNINL